MKNYYVIPIILLLALAWKPDAAIAADIVETEDLVPSPDLELSNDPLPLRPQVNQGRRNYMRYLENVPDNTLRGAQQRYLQGQQPAATTVRPAPVFTPTTSR